MLKKKKKIGWLYTLFFDVSLPLLPAEQRLCLVLFVSVAHASYKVRLKKVLSVEGMDMLLNFIHAHLIRHLGAMRNR